MTNAIDRAHGAGDEGPEGPLAPRLERLRALRSAFGALAASALSEAGRRISDSGRELTQRLAEARREGGATADAALAAIDRGLDAFESAMRALAREVPVAQLRSTLPGRLASDRRSVIDLLDLLLGDVLPADGGFADRIGAVDYLITLLCTHGARRRGVIAHDPVTLSARLGAICARADAGDVERIATIEAEFFGAANMDRAELREEFQRRTLRQRKVELGEYFFVPRILRAIVTYNAALLERVTDEILDAADWGVVEGDGEARADSSARSLFDSEPLKRIAGAARRRARGENLAAASPPSLESRIVSALDFDSLEPSEREALTQASVATPDDPIGTAILIGLLCRSLAVLSIELQDIGVSPDEVSDVWVGELDRVFQREIDARHASDRYKQAYALAELRTRFLILPVADQLREERELRLPPVHRPKPPACEPSTPNTPSSTSASNAATAQTPTDTRSTPDESSRPTARPTPEPAPTALVSRARSADAASAAAPRVEKSSARATPKSEPPAPPRRRERSGTARDLVREALEEDRRGSAKARSESSSRGLGSPTHLAAAALVVLSLAGAAFLMRDRPGRDLHRWTPEQLAIVSTYLVEGQRNGDGHGPAFVGTLDARWQSLPLDSRQVEAETMVERLREAGLQQVMVFDERRALRIQAIGSQPVRAL